MLRRQIAFCQLLIICTFLNNNLFAQTRSDKLSFGVCGHPLTQQAYYGSLATSSVRSSFDRQIGYIKELGMKYYRFGSGITLNTSFATYPLDLPSSWRINNSDITYLFNKLNENNIKPLYIVGYMPGNIYLSSLSDNFNTGYKQGEALAIKYGANIDYYELNNELELTQGGINGSLLTPPNCPNCAYTGTEINQYDSEKIKKTAAYLTGLNAGIKENDLNAKTIVNFASSHYGLLKALKISSPIAFNNEFDIIGCHLYSDLGDVSKYKFYGVGPEVNLLDSITSIYPNKEIWITETNWIQENKYTSQSQSEKDAQKNWINFTIDKYQTYKSFNGSYPIKTIIFYELLDQKYASPSTESNYGLVTCSDDNCEATLSKKAVYYQIKAKIEEIQNGGEYALSLSWNMDLGCNIGDEGGRQFWSGLLKTDTKYNVAYRLLGETYSVYLTNIYNQLSIKTVTYSNFESQYKSQFYASDWEGIIVSVASGDDIWNFANSFSSYGSNSTHRYVEYIFQKILGRSSYADQPGHDYWYNYFITNGTSIGNRKSFVSTIIKQDEYLNNFVVAQFKIFLQRDPNDSNVDGKIFWVNQMKAGLTQKQLVASLMSSDEYYQKALLRGSNYHNGVMPISSTLPPLVYIYNNSCQNLSSNGALYRLSNTITNNSISASPNPFSIEVKINIQLSNASNVDMKIFNTLGIEVYNKNTELSSGLNELNWKGIDNHGTPLPSGIYLINIFTNGQFLQNTTVIKE